MNPCLATGSLSFRHSGSPAILIWSLYPSSSSLPPRAPAAPCTAPLQTLSNCVSQLHCASFLVCVASFLYTKVWIYGGKPRGGRNKGSAQLPTCSSFNRLLITIPFLLLEAGAVPDSIEYLAAFIFLEKSPFSLDKATILWATEGPLSEKDFANLQSFPVKHQRTSSLEITGKHDCKIKVLLLLPTPGFCLELQKAISDRV